MNVARSAEVLAQRSVNLLMLYDARSILVIDVSPFGRALALLPAMRVLRQAYPNAFIAVAASSGVCELLLDAGLVTEAIDLGSNRPAGGPSFKRIIRLLRNARRFNFDLVVDLAPRPETQFLSRIMLRARTITPSRLPLVVELLAGASGRRGEQPAGYESVLRRLGLEAAAGRISVTPRPEENTRFEELLSRRGFCGGQPIVVLYSAGGPGAWPLTSFVEVAHRMANNFSARIVSCDEPSDGSFNALLQAQLPNDTIQLCEPRALELMAAVARASVLITDEPNLGAVARGMGTPVIDVTEPSQPRGRPGSKLAVLTPQEAYEEAAEILQESRSDSLFRQ